MSFPRSEVEPALGPADEGIMRTVGSPVRASAAASPTLAMDRAAEGAAQAPMTNLHRPSQAQAATILLAEDEALVRELICEILALQGYRILTAASGEEALATSRSFKEQIDLLVADVVMPRMTGPELAEALLLERPDLRILYASGFAGRMLVRSGALPAGYTFIAKPFLPADLTHAVRRLLAERPTMAPTPRAAQRPTRQSRSSIPARPWK
jgi:CheY-like chemotaxis protein